MRQHLENEDVESSARQSSGPTVVGESDEQKPHSDDAIRRTETERTQSTTSYHCMRDVEKGKADQPRQFRLSPQDDEITKAKTRDKWFT
jgi:hypothetical protein